MHKILEWPLPVSSGVQYLTPEKGGKIYFTGWTPTIGELDVGKNTVKEWPVPWRPKPPALGYAEGITYDPNSIPWFALTEAGTPQAGMIVSLNPKTSLFTGYGAGGYPRHLMFDAQGNVWYTGYQGINNINQCTAIVGTLNPQTLDQQYWLLPRPFIPCPEALWVDSQRNVWMSIQGGTGMQDVAAFARLQPSTDELTCWFIPAANPANFHGIVADEKGATVWISYETFQNPDEMAVFKFDVLSNTCLGYPHKQPPVYARQIFLDSRGTPWFADWFEKISTISPVAKCEKEVKIVSKTLRVQQLKVKTKTHRREIGPPEVAIIKPREFKIPVVEGCYTENILPPNYFNFAPNPVGAIAITPGKPDRIYYAVWAVQPRIGCLQP
jgi:streptogramin lyase